MDPRKQQELRAVSRPPMDRAQEPHPSWGPETPPVPVQESSRDSAASQPIPETLIKNLSSLTLDPAAKFPSALREDLPQQQDKLGKILKEISEGLPYKRRGVRTLLSARKERLVKLRYHLLLNSYSRKLEKELTHTGLKGVQSGSRNEPFRCGCSYCVHHGWDPSENARIGNYDTEAI